MFNEPKAGRLPSQWAFNHAIDLKDTFVSKMSKTYPLNPKEMNTCKEFIDKHLKSDKIHKSQSSQASPFFFVQKKDGVLCRWCNQISNSTHSSVVQGHIELLGSLKGNSERRPTGPELQLLSKGSSPKNSNCESDESW